MAVVGLSIRNDEANRHASWQAVIGLATYLSEAGDSNAGTPEKLRWAKTYFELVAAVDDRPVLAEWGRLASHLNRDRHAQPKK
jgi:hypothetical protein